MISESQRMACFFKQKQASLRRLKAVEIRYNKCLWGYLYDGWIPDHCVIFELFCQRAIVSTCFVNFFINPLKRPNLPDTTLRVT
jgi:hypothetical protein